jgi:hypothetical protein
MKKKVAESNTNVRIENKLKMFEQINKDKKEEKVKENDESKKGSSIQIE